MQYICPDLICPYCGKHTYIDIEEGTRYVVSKQVCRNCGKTFTATMQKPREKGELNSEDEIFLNYGTSKLKGKENG